MKTGDIGELERLATKMRAWDDLASEQECVKCCAVVHAPGELEPSPLCNLCAQAVAGELPALIRIIGELEAKLARLNASIEGSR